MPDGFGGFGVAWKVAAAVPDENGNAWGRPKGFGNGARRADEGDSDDHEFQGSRWTKRCKTCGANEDAHGGGSGALNVPPPGQRHAAGYMEPDESRDYLELLKQRQAQGLPPDPRDGGSGWGR